MGHIKPRLKALFAHKPVGRALVLRKGPFIEARQSSAIRGPEVHQGADPEWTD